MRLVERKLKSEPKGANFSDSLKQLRYFTLSMVALLLSACFPVAELQFLALSVIAGAKWIVGGSSGKINIFIN